MEQKNKIYIVLQYGNTIRSEEHPTCYVGAKVYSTLEDAQAELTYKVRVWTHVHTGEIWNTKKTKNKFVIKYYNGKTDTFEIIERNI